MFSTAIEFLGLRGFVIAAILGVTSSALAIVGGWQWLRAESAEAAASISKAELIKSESALNSCVEANESAEAVISAKAQQDEKNKAAYEAAVIKSTAALNAATKNKAATEKTSKQWEQRWDSKSKECSTALKAIDSVCSNIDGY